MELIFHERQEGSLCAQHCLNALLQGSFFTAVDLGSISQQLDDQERERMAEGGVLTEEYRRFLDQPSSNMDDSGFFSVQVISNALGIWGLEMIPFGSTMPLAVDARSAPTEQSAFICNFREHWFSVRKIGSQWFNLNSMLTGPELISGTYLSLFLTQLQQEGYSIFIVIGSLPDCEAESVLRVAPASQSSPPRLLRQQQQRQQPDNKVTSPIDSADMDLAMLTAMEASRNEIDDEDSSLQRAMELSLRSAPKGAGGIPPEAPSTSEEAALSRALALSLAASVGAPVSSSSSSASAASAAASTASAASAASTVSASAASAAASTASSRMPLADASQSNSAQTAQKSPSVEDVRRKRLEFLQKQQQPQEQQEQQQQQQLQQPRSASDGGRKADEEMDEEAQLALALKMSQEGNQ